MSGQFPLRVSPSGPFEEVGESSLLATLAQFSKFGTGITEEILMPILGPGMPAVVSVSGPIPNTGAPSSGQLFEIDATLAIYFLDGEQLAFNNTVSVSCELELDDGSSVFVSLPGPASRVTGGNFSAIQPYDWTARARATVPAGRTVVEARLKIGSVDDTGKPRVMGGDPSPHSLKITRVR